MSRSFRKNPYIGLACAGRKGVSKWKKETNRSTRRRINASEETPPRNFNKKYVDTWDHPADGKVFRPEYKKGFRK